MRECQVQVGFDIIKRQVVLFTANLSTSIVLIKTFFRVLPHRGTQFNQLFTIELQFHFSKPNYA